MRCKIWDVWPVHRKNAIAKTHAAIPGCARTFFTFKATKTQDIIIMIESQSLNTGDDFKELLDITLQHV